MADDLEDNSHDTDRSLDQNGFLNQQFDIFTHDYREKADIPKCAEHEGGSSCCGESHETCTTTETPRKKELINTTRRLQRALLILNSAKNKEPIQDLINELEKLNVEFQNLINKETAEFSTTTVKLPDYDSVDMELLLGKEEVPNSSTLLDTVKMDRKAGRERMFHVIAEAEILLKEFDDIKRHISAESNVC